MNLIKYEATKVIALVLFFLLIMVFSSSLTAQNQILFCRSPENDLYKLIQNEKLPLSRYENLEQLLVEAKKGMGIIVVADNYPSKKVAITKKQYDLIRQKNLRLYIEFPESIPGQMPAETYAASLERAVISSDFFGSTLPGMSILGINGCHIIPVNTDKPLICLAKVAGFDHAIYGLSETQVYPLLYLDKNFLIATTKLSDFKKARFGPSGSWKKVWESLLEWILKKNGMTIRSWESDPSPAYSSDEKLPSWAKRNAVENGAKWLWNARLFIHPSWEKEIAKYQPRNGDPNLFFGPPVGKDQLIGDGSRGIMEGHASAINFDGTQKYRYFIRADVQGESAFLLAASGNLLENNNYKMTSERLLDYLFYTSEFRGGNKNIRDNAVYGLLSWANTHPGVFFNDDNARCILGVIGATAFLKNERWNKFIVENILANLRTCSKQGFQGNALNEKQVMEKGWRFYNERDFINIHPHFESWMWACYLWLYDKTHYKPLLDKAKAGIKITMDAYPDNWLTQNGIQQERARMILPLAWLVRIENTEEHRKWLNLIVSKLLESQVACGAIREELGSSDSDKNKLIITSNKNYGSNEASLIAKNGDPVSDMLYTCNFAFFALNEAAQATGNPKYKEAVSKLSDFLVRVQAKSKNHTDIDGAWFRAFDYNRWDYWASNADNGWGAWSTLTGWIQSWIVSTQVLIEMDQSYWEVTKNINMEKELNNSLWMLN